MTELEQEEEFTILTELELEEAEIERAIDEVKADTEELSDGDITEMVASLRQLEEKLILWREVRQQTILELREVADYIDSVARKTGIAKVVGSSGGVLAGGLTIAGGVMTVLTAGAALPVLAAGAGLGLASGLTGASAAISNKIITSRQMARANLAIEVDSAATKELESRVEIVQKDQRMLQLADLAFTVGGLASSTKAVVDVCTGAAAGGTLVPSLEALGQILGERANKTIMKLLARTSGQVLSGSVTLVFGGVTMLWDMYNLRSGVKQLADGSEEGARLIREIADQLEQALTEMTEHQRTSQT